MNRTHIKILIQFAFSVIAVIALWYAGVNPYDLIMSAWWPVLTLLQFSLLLICFTSLPYRYFLAALGIGTSLVPLITYLVQKPLSLLLEGSGLQSLLSRPEYFGTIGLTAPLIAPVTEEITKLIPVIIIFFILLRFKKYRLLSPVDFALLGLFAGAGFDIFENICRSMNGFYDMNGLYRSSINEPLPGFFGIYLFPSIYRSEYLGNPMIWFGHSGYAACISMAFGWFLYLKKKRYAFLPVLILLISMFDHSMWNWYQPYPEQLWAIVLPKFTLYGRLIPVFYTVGLLASIGLLLKNKRRFEQELRQIKTLKETPGNPLFRLSLILALRQRENQLTNAFRHYLKKGIKAEPFDFVVQEIIGKPAGRS